MSPIDDRCEIVNGPEVCHCAVPAEDCSHIIMKAEDVEIFESCAKYICSTC